MTCSESYKVWLSLQAPSGTPSSILGTCPFLNTTLKIVSPVRWSCSYRHPKKGRVFTDLILGYSLLPSKEIYFRKCAPAMSYTRAIREENGERFKHSLRGKVENKGLNVPVLTEKNCPSCSQLAQRLSRNLQGSHRLSSYMQRSN